MNKNILKGLALASVAGLTLAGCASAPAEPTVTPVDYKACMVSDEGGFDDGSFNEEAYNGLKEAIAVLGVQSAEAQSESADQYQPNVDSMVAEGCNIIVPVGFALGAATDVASAANPSVNFAPVDTALSNPDFSPKYVSNVKPLLFDTAEAAFLAGYVAAATTQTGKVATFGGMAFPSVTIFMDGFKQGVAYYNEAKGTSVEVLGAEGDDQSKWAMTGDFADVSKGKTTSENFIKQGADIILPVAGLTLAGCASAPAEPTVTPVDYKACMVSDEGGFDDGSFNEEAYNGLKKAIAVLGVQSAEAQSQSDADFQPNVDAMVSEGCNIIVPVGFALGAATDVASAANPDVMFAPVDTALSNADFSPKYVDNVKPLLFDTAEAAFLAGYVAAATTQTGKVATFGGMAFPSVTIF